MTKARSKKKSIGPRARKAIFLRMNATHVAKHGQTLSEAGTAALRRKAATKACASAVAVVDDRRSEESRGSVAAIAKLQAHVTESAAQEILDQRALRDAKDAAALAEKGWCEAENARREAETARRTATAREERAKTTLAAVRREFSLLKQETRSAARSASTAGSTIIPVDGSSASERIALKKEVVLLRGKQRTLSECRASAARLPPTKTPR